MLTFAAGRPWRVVVGLGLLLGAALDLAGCSKEHATQARSQASTPASASTPTTSPPTTSPPTTSSTSTSTTSTLPARTAEDGAFLEALRRQNLSRGTEDDVIRFGRQICQTLRSGTRFSPGPSFVDTRLGSIVIRNEELRLVQAALGAYCPEFAGYISFFPDGSSYVKFGS